MVMATAKDTAMVEGDSRDHTCLLMFVLGAMREFIENTNAPMKGTTRVHVGSLEFPGILLRRVCYPVGTSHKRT